MQADTPVYPTRVCGYLTTTTNQKQAAVMEGSMKERRDEQKTQGKHDTIVFGGALELMDVKN